jgi:hypothetical protein
MPPTISRICTLLNAISVHTPAKAATSFGALKVNAPTGVELLNNETAKVESTNGALMFGVLNCGSTKSKPYE